MLALSVATAGAEQLAELGLPCLSPGLRCVPHVDPGQQVILTAWQDIK